MMNVVDQADCLSICQKLASQTGFTGLSILHRLHRLYKFDVLKQYHAHFSAASHSPSPSILYR